MSRAIRILARALTLAAISVPGAITASTAQRQIEVDAQHRSDAVLFTAVTVGNMDVQCGLVVSRSAIQTVTPFDAGDDWLQNTVLYLINRTNKTAVFGQIALWFPDTGSGSPSQPTRVFILSLGRLPRSAAFSGSTGKPLSQPSSAQPMSFAPGQTLGIHLGDYIDGIRASVDNLPFPAVTRVIIRRNSFVFDDGMQWTPAGFASPDPQNPGRWVNMAPSYFPGDVNANWPQH